MENIIKAAHDKKESVSIHQGAEGPCVTWKEDDKIHAAYKENGAYVLEYETAGLQIKRERYMFPESIIARMDGVTYK